MKAIILAAGRGTRLRPLTYGIPKPLLPVKGRPMLDWVISSIVDKSIDEIIVAVSGTVGNDAMERVLTHIHGICIDSYLKNANYNFNIRTIPTPQRETAGDLRYVLEEIGMRSGEVLVVYGDNITSFNMSQFVDYHRSCRKELGTSASVVLFEAPEQELHRFGIAKVNQIKNFTMIEKFVEKPSLAEAPSRLASAGYYILEVGDVLEALSREKVKVENSLFPTLASQGKLAGFVTKLPYWIDISTMEAYNLANQLAHDNLILPPPVHDDKDGRNS